MTNKCKYTRRLRTKCTWCKPGLFKGSKEIAFFKDNIFGGNWGDRSMANVYWALPGLGVTSQRVDSEDYWAQRTPDNCPRDNPENFLPAPVITFFALHYMGCSKELKLPCKSHGKEIQNAAYSCAREISLKNVGFRAVAVLVLDSGELTSGGYRITPRQAVSLGTLPWEISKK